LESQVKCHSLVGRVHLPGITCNVSAELSNSHVIAFPSRYGGFPNALAEGLAVGLPAVAYLDVSGVEDLIIEGETGFLVDLAKSSLGLAEALERLVSNPSLRSRLGANARQRTQLWRPEIICELWEKQLRAATGRRGAA
jgi:glycosyltransferase involved in cell wall biosynthesis